MAQRPLKKQHARLCKLAQRPLEIHLEFKVRLRLTRTRTTPDANATRMPASRLEDATATHIPASAFKICYGTTTVQHLRTFVTTCQKQLHETENTPTLHCKLHSYMRLRCTRDATARYTRPTWHGGHRKYSTHVTASWRNGH